MIFLWLFVHFYSFSMIEVLVSLPFTKAMFVSDIDREYFFFSFAQSVKSNIKINLRREEKKRSNFDFTIFF